MKKRQIIIVAIAVAIVVVSFVVSGRMGKSKAVAPVASKPDMARLIRVAKVENSTLPNQVEVTGRLVAADRIELFAEVNGILLPAGKPFKAGVSFRQGEVLLAIDSEEARLGILAQKSTLLNQIAQLMPDLKIDFPESYARWEAYLAGFDVNKPLKALPEPASSKEKFFITSRNIYNTFYTIQGQESRLQKYKVIAPFNGTLTEATITRGTLVRTGQKLGEYISTDSYELEGAVGIHEIKYLKPGDKVRMSSADITGEWTGTVKRISDKIDPSTQTFKVFIETRGADLKDGMYLSGTIEAGQIEGVREINRNLLVNKGFVYAVANGALTLVPVDVVKYTAKGVIVRGLPQGAEVLSEPVSGAYEGMSVKTVSTGS